MDVRQGPRDKKGQGAGGRVMGLGRRACRRWEEYARPRSRAERAKSRDLVSDGASIGRIPFAVSLSARDKKGQGAGGRVMGLGRRACRRWEEYARHDLAQSAQKAETWFLTSRDRPDPFAISALRARQEGAGGWGPSHGAGATRLAQMEEYARPRSRAERAKSRDLASDGASIGRIPFAVSALRARQEGAGGWGPSHGAGATRLPQMGRVRSSRSRAERAKSRDLVSDVASIGRILLRSRLSARDKKGQGAGGRVMGLGRRACRRWEEYRSSTISRRARKKQRPSF